MVSRDLETVVCNAARQWELAVVQTDSGTRDAAEHALRSRAAEDAAPSGTGLEDKSAKKTGTAPAASRDKLTLPGMKTNTARRQELAETGNDVLSLRRLGRNLYGTTLRSGEVWSGDSTLFKTLPHGEAKMATLLVGERMAQQTKSKASAKDTGMQPTEALGEPTEKKQRMQGDTSEQQETDAAEHCPVMMSAATAAGERPERPTDTNATDSHFFSEDDVPDHALLQYNGERAKQTLGEPTKKKTQTQAIHLSIQQQSWRKSERATAANVTDSNFFPEDDVRDRALMQWLQLQRANSNLEWKFTAVANESIS